MVTWNIHNKYALKLGISSIISQSVNRFIDIEKRHDIGRLIKNSRWDFKIFKEEFTQAIKEVYEKWGIDGIKAFILHHFLDYLYTLINDPNVMAKGACEPFNRLEYLIESPSASNLLHLTRVLIPQELRNYVIKCINDIRNFINNNRASIVKDLLNCSKLISTAVKYLTGYYKKPRDPIIKNAIEQFKICVNILEKNNCEDIIKAVDECRDIPCISALAFIGIPDVMDEKIKQYCKVLGIDIVQKLK